MIQEGEDKFIAGTLKNRVGDVERGALSCRTCSSPILGRKEDARGTTVSLVRVRKMILGG